MIRKQSLLLMFQCLLKLKFRQPPSKPLRMDLTRSKSPAELARISGIRDIPIPGLWTEHTMAKEAVKKQKKRCV